VNTYNKIINRIEKESAQANREITKIIKQEFEQVSLVTERIEEIKKSLKYHLFFTFWVNWWSEPLAPVVVRRIGFAPDSPRRHKTFII
jgi:hypothetical protein